MFLRRSTTTTTTRSPFDFDTPSNGDYFPLQSSGHCGREADVGYIVGGEETKRGEMPFLAALGYKTAIDGKFNYNCGGALINRLNLKKSKKNCEMTE